MATVSTPASLSSVRSVFGGPSPPANLRAYLRGAGYVPNLSSMYNDIAESGLLLLSSYAGKIHPVAQLHGGSAVTTAFGTSASVIYTLSSSGNETLTRSPGGVSYSGQWKLAGDSSRYEAYLSGTGNSPTGSALNTWLPLSSGVSWTLSVLNNSKEFSGTIQIRWIESPFPVLATASLHMYVESEP